jgi:hypothetical protein
MDLRARFTRRLVATALLAGTLPWAAGLAAAQPFPTRTVTIVVPFPPAGGADTLARTLAPKLSALWGQTVLVENRPGASGRIGTEQVANAGGRPHARDGVDRRDHREEHRPPRPGGAGLGRGVRDRRQRRRADQQCA